MNALELLLPVLGAFDASGVSGIVQHALLAASDSDGGGAWLLLAGPAAGAGVYWALYRYYRNTDKSHRFEQETLIEAQPVTGSDAKVDEVRGTQRRRIDGDNSQKHRHRVRRIH